MSKEATSPCSYRFSVVIAIVYQMKPLTRTLLQTDLMFTENRFLHVSSNWINSING